MERESKRVESGLTDVQHDDFVVLGEALNALVDYETRHIHSEILTGKIVRAVRQSSLAPWRFDDTWSRALVAWFRPVAIVGSLVVLLLAAYNVGRSEPVSYELSTAERVFGMHPVTLATAYDLDLASRPE
jgi:hypothetical protein